MVSQGYADWLRAAELHLPLSECFPPRATQQTGEEGSLSPNRRTAPLKVLAGLCVYTRKETVKHWMRAWTNAEKYNDAKLVVVHNHDTTYPPPDQRYNIGVWKPDFYHPRKNYGQ